MALAMSSSCNARWLSAIFCLAYLGSRLGIGLGLRIGLGLGIGIGIGLGIGLG